MRLLVLSSFFQLFWLSGLSAQSAGQAVQDQLAELTYQVWFDPEVRSFPREVYQDVQAGRADFYFDLSIQMLESAVQPMDSWQSLSEAQQAAYLTDVSFFFVTSLVALKLGVLASRSLKSEIWHQSLKMAGYRVGPREPLRLPSFLRSKFYQDFQEELRASPDLTRMQKRKLSAYFRAKAIHRYQPNRDVRIPRPEIEGFEWQLWESRLNEAFIQHRRARAENRFENFPKNHHRLLGVATPHIDEVLINIVDFTQDQLSRRQQQQLILYLQKVAHDLTQRGRPSDRMSFRPQLAMFLSRHEELRRFWVSWLMLSVRSDEPRPLSPLSRGEADPNYLAEIREEMHRRFQELICGENFRWFGLQK